MHMVAPRTGAEEVTVAEDQLEYKPLVAARYQTPDGVPVLLTRWRFTDEDRARVAAGGDLYLSVMTFGQPLQPIGVQIGPDGWMMEPRVADQEDSDAGA